MARVGSRVEFSRYKGCAPSLVTYWSKLGLLAFTPDGKVDFVRSDALIAAHSAPDRGGRRGKPRTRTAEPPPPAQDVDAGPSYAKVRTAREAYAVKQAELDYRTRIGELVERAKYDKALADALGPALSRLDTLSARVAARVMGETDLRRAQTIIDDEVAAIRQEMADAVRALIATGGQTRQ